MWEVAGVTGGRIYVILLALDPGSDPVRLEAFEPPPSDDPFMGEINEEFDALLDIIPLPASDTVLECTLTARDLECQ